MRKQSERRYESDGEIVRERQALIGRNSNDGYGKTRVAPNSSKHPKAHERKLKSAQIVVDEFDDLMSRVFGEGMSDDDFLNEWDALIKKMRSGEYKRTNMSMGSMSYLVPDGYDWSKLDEDIAEAFREAMDEKFKRSFGDYAEEDDVDGKGFEK